MDARAPFTTPRVPLIISWTEITDHHNVSKCCYHWVSDESIAQALETPAFDPPDVPHTPTTNRAERIASIVKLMKTGVVFDPLVLDVTPTKIHLRDGHHRLRAYQFLKELEKIPVSVAGCVNKILHACCKEPRSIKSNGSSIEIHTPRPQGDLHPSQ